LFWVDFWFFGGFLGGLKLYMDLSRCLWYFPGVLSKNNGFKIKILSKTIPNARFFSYQGSLESG
jgi:hypothetical protein